MTLYYTYENNPYKAEEFANMLVKDFPNNPIFEKWFGRISIKKGDYLAGSKIFTSIMSKAKKIFPVIILQKQNGRQAITLVCNTGTRSSLIRQSIFLK